MAKRKNGSIATVQYTSTSEAVKTRPRKRTKNTTLPAAKKAPKVEDKQVHVRSSQPILVHLDELAKIWDNDKRIPTVESRHARALARNVKPDHVHRWWARRKQIAKKARQAIPKGTYELPVGTPPVVKNEATPPPFPPRSRTTILPPPLPIPSSPPLQDLGRILTPRSPAPFPSHPGPHSLPVPHHSLHLPLRFHIHLYRCFVSLLLAPLFQTSQSQVTSGALKAALTLSNHPSHH